MMLMRFSLRFKNSSLTKFCLPKCLDIGNFRNYTTNEREEKATRTMADVYNEMNRRMGIDHGYQPIPKSREHLSKYEPKLEDLPSRSMRDSFTSAIIPLSTDKILQDKYVTSKGHVRMGRLLEDMDLFAGWVMHNHVKLPKLPENVPLPYTFVTVLVDKVDFSVERKDVNHDIRISGHVSWVGRSTMEIFVWLEQIQGDEKHLITRAVFLMAARNATNTAALAVNPLAPADDKECKIFSEGQERKNRRKILQETSIFKVQPNECEQSLMYSLYQRTSDLNSMELNKRILPPNCRWMSDSYAMNTVASFPENRNAQNTVFGGFLMRNALEISWVAAKMYCHQRSMIKHLCDISFDKPVNVDSILKMNAYVIYTEANYITIMTVVDILDSVSGKQLTSNVFYPIFETLENVPEVLPRSYQETMWYIQGRRKFRYSHGLE